MCMFLKLIEDSKLSYSFLFLFIIFVIIWVFYSLDIDINLNENFKSQVNYKSLNAKKEMEILNKINEDNKKNHNPNLNFSKNTVSQVFDIKNAPQKYVSWKKYSNEKQNLKDLEHNSGESIKGCYPKLKFDGIHDLN